MCWRGGLSRFCAPVLQDCFLAALKLPGVSRWILPLVDICFYLFPFPSEQISLKRCFHRCFSFQIPVQNPFFFLLFESEIAHLQGQYRFNSHRYCFSAFLVL